MTVMTFEEWREENKDLSDQMIIDGVDLECQRCDGTGLTDCGECGHEKECDECVAGVTEKPSEWTIRDRMRILYDEQVTCDADKLAAWNAVLEV